MFAARRERGIAGRERLDHEAAPARGSSAPPTAARRPCSCTRVQPDAPDDLDDVLGPLVAEHADGVHLRAAAACTMSRTRLGVDLPRLGANTKPERVGAERGREQRVVSRW